GWGGGCGVGGPTGGLGAREGGAGNGGARWARCRAGKRCQPTYPATPMITTTAAATAKTPYLRHSFSRFSRLRSSSTSRMKSLTEPPALEKSAVPYSLGRTLANNRVPAPRAGAGAHRRPCAPAFGVARRCLPPWIPPDCSPKVPVRLPVLKSMARLSACLLYVVGSYFELSIYRHSYYM